MEVPEVTPSIFDALPCFRDGCNLRLDDGGWATTLQDAISLDATWISVLI